MTGFCSFLKKEIIEGIRTYKFIIMLIIFILVGLMNPVIAKLTPMILEYSNSTGNMGMQFEIYEITAIDSWQQFYKNIPMALIITVLMLSNAFVGEYQRGTLVLVITKGLSRYKIFLAKAFVINLVWTLGYLVCFVVTYISSDILWDNSIMNKLVFSAVCYLLFGIMMLSVMILSSVIAKSFVGVLIGPVAVFFGYTILGMIPKLGKYLPTKLSEPACLTNASYSAYYVAMAFAVAITIGCHIAGMLLFNKKNI